MANGLGSLGKIVKQKYLPTDIVESCYKATIDKCNRAIYKCISL